LNEKQKRIKAKRQVKTFKDGTEAEPHIAQHFRTTGRVNLRYRDLYKDNRQAK